MKDIFNKTLFFLTIVFISIFTISSLNKVNASSPSIVLTNGASVRTSGDNGLKFQAIVSNPTDNATYGMIFVRGRSNDFTVNTTGVFDASVDGLLAGNKFLVTMVNFPENAYAQDISVRAYVKLNNNYIYSDNTVICNLYEKAAKLKEKENYVESELIENIVANTKLNFKVYTGNDTSLHSDMVKDFLNDFNTYMNGAFISENFFALTYNKFDSIKCDAFFNDSIYSNKWNWMFDYINEVRIENGKASLNTSIGYAYYRGEIHNFLNLNQTADDVTYGCSYTNRSDYRYSLSGKAPYELPILSKDGFNFLGWTYENSSEVLTYATSLSSLYPKFESATNVAVNVNLELNGGYLDPLSMNTSPLLTTEVTKYGNGYSGVAAVQYISPIVNNKIDSGNSGKWHERLVLKYDANIDAYEIINYYAAGKDADYTNATHVFAKASALDFSASADMIGKFIKLSEPLTTEGDVDIDLYFFEKESFTTYNKTLVEETLLPTPYKTNHTFMGWYLDSSLTGDKVDSYPGYKEDIQNITYYAKWENTSSDIEPEPDVNLLETKVEEALNYVSDVAESDTIDTLLQEEEGISFKYTSSNNLLYTINNYDYTASVSRYYQTHKKQNVTVTVTGTYNGESYTLSKEIIVNPVLFNDLPDTPIATYFATSAAYTYRTYNTRYKTDGTLFSESTKETLDIVYYAFATVASDATVALSDSSYVNQLNELKNHNVRIIVSLNGAVSDGQINFYNITRNETLLNKFITNVANLVEQYNFDGVDIDWEYNSNYPTEKAYYTKLVTGLYNELASRQDADGTPYMLTAAIPGTSWGTSSDRYDYQVLSTYLDYINVMSYDLNQSGYTTHVSPLYTPSSANSYSFSLDYAVSRFASLGFPKEKLILGCAGYGKLYTITGTINSSAEYVGLGLAGTLSQYPNTVGSYASGTLFSNAIEKLIATGKFVEYHNYNSSGKFVGSYLYNYSEKLFATYDSSFAIKEKYKYADSITGVGLMCWSYTENTNDSVIDAMTEEKNS